MTLLAATVIRRTALLAAALLACPGLHAGAQIQLTHTEDAAPVPMGMLRLRVTSGWTRHDQRFGVNGRTFLGDELSADPLGTRQLPLLAPVEGAVQALSADPGMRLSLGRLVTRGDARIVTTPISLEYGVTRRFTIGVVVPVVQTRHTVSVDVNSAPFAAANVGLVPATERAAAADANMKAANSYGAAAQQLADLLARCQATPSGAGCGAATSDPVGAAAARALAIQFGAAATALGRTATNVSLAPRATSTLALEIEAQRTALNRELQRYLGADALQTSAVYYAPTNFSYIDLQGRDGAPGLLQSQLAGGLDSIHTTERLSIGDISINAQWMVFDRFQRDTLPIRGAQMRLAVGGAVRFATGRPDTVTNLVDIGTGEGGALEARSALDLIRGRLGATVAARYVRTFSRFAYAPRYGDPDAGGFPLPSFGLRIRSPGDVVNLDLTPRYMLSESFAVDGHYGLEREGAVTYGPATPVADPPAFCAGSSLCDAPVTSARTAHRLGVGLRYSTVDGYARGTTRFPVEISYVHLTTIRGDPGVAKISREQIQLRLFYRLFGT